MYVGIRTNTRSCINHKETQCKCNNLLSTFRLQTAKRPHASHRNSLCITFHYYLINLCHKYHYGTPDYIVAMYMNTYMYVVQQFHVSETICYSPCFRQLYRYKCRTIDLYTSNRKWCGAEFRAETYALCSRVKSRNTQFPEHYPHVPTGRHGASRPYQFFNIF